jgi:hypothetical protein
MSSARAKILRVPLSPRLYEALRTTAERERRPATVVARDAIAEWLSNRRSRAVEDELRAYVAAAAGTRDDLDGPLEAASVVLLTSVDITTMKRHKRR